MVKDEDVCLHCGLCAERCPTGAWDMQKFLIEMTQARTRACRIREAVRTISSSGSPTSTARARPAPTGCSPVDPAHGRAGRAAQYLSRPTSRACRPGTRCGSREAGHLGARGGVDLMVAMNPQTWDADVAGDRARRLSVLRFDQAAAGVEVPRRHHRHRRAADRDLQRANTPTRASASCSRTSSMSARCRRCSTSTAEVIETLIARAVQGQGKADRSQHRRRCAWAATTRATHLPCPIGLRVRARRHGRRPHLHRGQ